MREFLAATESGAQPRTLKLTPRFAGITRLVRSHATGRNRE